MTSLVDLLEHARPGTLVALDIDDTICCNRYHPCLLMTDPGLEAFRAALGEVKKQIIYFAIFFTFLVDFLFLKTHMF
jgi:hypothetical protein